MAYNVERGMDILILTRPEGQTKQWITILSKFWAGQKFRRDKRKSWRAMVVKGHCTYKKQNVL